MHKSPQDTTRRDFFKASAAIGVAVGTADVARAALPAAWDREADVVVVGSGAAGLSAAVAAVREGASVVIVEKAPSAGGTTSKSGGAYWIPNNHLMQAKGLADPKEDALNFMARYSYPALYREDQPRRGLSEQQFGLIEAFYDNAGPLISDLDRAGILQSIMVELPDYADHLPQNKAPMGRIMFPKSETGGNSLGPELVRQLRSWLTARKVPFLFRHPVSDLKFNAAGQVVGVAAQSPSGEVSIRARKGVVFGSGGYTHNPEMILNHQPGPSWGGCAVPTNEGDFINIGIRAGTKLGNMANAWRAQIVLEQALESASVSRDIFQPPGDSMIMVNRTGRRVVNEKRNYTERTLIHFAWDANESDYPNKFLFMIYDQRNADIYAGSFPLPEAGSAEAYVLKANTIPDLAQALQTRLDSLSARIGNNTLDPDFTQTLQDQIARFNEAAVSGTDEDFLRGKYPYDAAHHPFYSVADMSTAWPANKGPSPVMYPLSDKGPYYAIIVAAGTLDTNGGPVIDARAQVLDTHDKPIPGLFGAGNCIAAPSASAYWGAGGTLGPALVFGAMAGANAANSQDNPL